MLRPWGSPDVSQTPRRNFRAGRIVSSSLLLSFAFAADAVTGNAQLHDATLQARALIAEAQRVAAAGRSSEAQSLARRALALAPGDASLVQECQVILGSQGERSSPAMDRQVLRAWALAEASAAQARAQDAAGRGRHADAVEILTVVVRALRQQGLEADPATAEVIERLRNEIAVQSRRQREQEEGESASGRQARLKDATAESLGQDTLRERRIQERLARIREMRRLGQREAALAEVRRLSKEEPERSDIRELQAKILGDAHEGRRQDVATLAAEQREELAALTREALLPGRQDGLPAYPEGWTARHPGNIGAQVLDQSQEAPWVAALHDRLAARISLKLEQVPLPEAVAQVARQAGVNIVIDPVLAAADHPISLDAPSIRCDNALTWITRQAGTTWGLSQEAVAVGTIAAPPPALAVYDVANLVQVAQDQPGRHVTYDASGAADARAAAAAPESHPATAEDLANLIKTTVRPETWEDGLSGITIRGNVLFVTAQPDVHRLVKELIRAQEAVRGMMVRVEARWLTVKDAFFEKSGVSWTTPSLLYGGINNPGVARSWAEGNVAGAVRNTLPAGATEYGASPSAAMQLSVAHFGPLQLSAILEAGERSGQIRDLQSPVITTLNGVRANVFYVRERGYIGDYQITQGTMDPQVQIMTSGMVLDVKPLVSSDRKYVTLDLKPTVTSVVFSSDVITAITGTNGRGANTTGLGGIVALRTYPIELPNTAVRSAATTVTIPDRGSLLVGGFGKVIDERLSAGVPYLSDIPYLGRLFGTRARGSERSDLYLLTTVTIISYDELETAL